MADNSAAFSIVVGANPALQKRFILSSTSPKLVPGDVHRASNIQVGIGGKGQDVAVTLGCLSAGTPYVYLAQFLGKGPEGDLALSLMKEILREKDDNCDGLTSALEALTVRTDASLRTCTTIVAQDSATELVEPSGMISPGEIQMLFDKINQFTSHQEVRGLCIMGSMPPGCPDNLYGAIFEKAMTNNPQAVAIIDTVVGLEPLFEQMKAHIDVTHGNRILKVNLAELCRLANVYVKSETSEASLEQIHHAVHGFLSTFAGALTALDYIAITNGCHPAHLACIQREAKESEDAISKLFRIKVPSLSIVQKGNQSQIFPIGAGDSVAAGTLAACEYLCTSDGRTERLHSSVQNALKQKLDSTCADPTAVSFAFGIACGSASCIQEENSVLDVDDVLTLFKNVDIEIVSSNSSKKIDFINIQ
jgi:fructose-1-phosphate kinase PfkB-like protein